MKVAILGLAMILLLGFSANAQTPTTPITLTPIRYVATVANDSATTAETTVFSVILDTNAFADNEELDVMMNCVNRQFSGAAANFTLKVKFQGQTYTAVNSSVANLTAIGKAFKTFKFYRQGADVYMNVVGGIAAGGTSVTQALNTLDYFNGTVNSTGTVFNGVNFAQSITIEITAQWSTANANTYFNVLSGYVTKY